LGLETPKKRRIVSTRIGIAPKEYTLYTDLTVEQNIWFFAKLYNMDRGVFLKKLWPHVHKVTSMNHQALLLANSNAP
jgi:ABC-type Na+ transport system ATPase subunit NatA